MADDPEIPLKKSPGDVIVGVALALIVPPLATWISHGNPWIMAGTTLLAVLFGGVAVAGYLVASKNKTFVRASRWVAQTVMAGILLLGVKSHQDQIDSMKANAQGADSAASEVARAANARILRLSSDSARTANAVDPLRDRELRNAKLYDDVENFKAEGKRIVKDYLSGTPENPTPPYARRVAAIGRWHREVLDWTKRNRLASEREDWEGLESRFPYADVEHTGMSMENAVQERLSQLGDWQKKFSAR